MSTAALEHLRTGDGEGTSTLYVDRVFVCKNMYSEGPLGQWF